MFSQQTSILIEPCGLGYSQLNALESADQLMELMSDIVINPTFPAPELEKYKKRRQAQLEEQRSDPGFLGREKFRRVLYGDFPASVVAPSVQSLTSVRVEDLRKFHDTWFTPGNAILGIVGDLTIDQAKLLANKFFGSWRDHPISAIHLPPIAPLGARQIYLIDRPGSVQTNILAGA